ncbi:MAG: hypothetical protein ACTSR3_14960, partial [Candidatus Helarchaeota archaeon]
MNAKKICFFQFSISLLGLKNFLVLVNLMIIHPSLKMVRTGSKITCESRQRTVGCCPRIIEVVVLGNTNLLP